jgi:nitrite reductase/ring-hydroxylating ferredoxin subunit
VKVTVGLPALQLGDSVVVQAGGRRVLVCRSADGVHALDEICPHQRQSLAGGRIRGTSLFCPHHGARFSLEDGRSLSPVTPDGLKLYPCIVAGDRLEIEI